MIMMQNTQKVRSTKDLDNSFHMVIGFHFDSRKFDQAHKIYQAQGRHIFILDCNDEKKVSLCIAGSCEYTFNLVLESTINTRTLTIVSSYAGGLLLNNPILIAEVTVMYDGVSVHVTLDEPIEIAGPKEIQIPINDPDMSTLHLMREN